MDCLVDLLKFSGSFGLALDFIGAFIISYDYYFELSDKNIDKYATIRADGGEGQKEFLRKQRQSIRRGLPFLLFGFFFQLLGSLINLCIG